MSLPEVLCVDDSEAILAFERSVLGRHYAVRTATDGLQALAALARERPACVLLDLSMPGMDGDVVLAKMKADRALREIPVIIVSSETTRAESCVASGAVAFLPKPLRAAELEACVERALAEEQRRLRRGSLAVLPLTVGGVALAVALEGVIAVLLQPETIALPGGPPSVASLIEYHGRPVCVLDLAVALGVEHGVSLVERHLVLVQGDGQGLALAVDSVADPEEVAAKDVTRPGTGDHSPLVARALVATVQVGGRAVPVIEPSALLAADVLPALPDLVARALARVTR